MNLREDEFNDEARGKKKKKPKQYSWISCNTKPPGKFSRG